MADFSPLYTGKNTATILPSGEGTQRALGELTDMVKTAEEIKYKTFKENEKWFLENANIDPVFVISTAARRSQMELIQRFNKKWVKRAQETNYNLNNQDKMQMMTDKDVITSEAQGQLAQMEMWKQHDNLVKQNPAKFDLTKFALATQEYMRTGKYTQTMPAFQPIDFGNYAQEQANKLGFNADKAPVVAGGQRGFEAWNIPKGDVGRFIVSQLGENPQADVDFWNRWGKADKQYWINRGEQEKKNPIMLWAENEFPNVRQSKYQYMKNIPKETSGGGLIINIGGSNVKLSPGWQRSEDITYGDTIYSNNYAFNSPASIINVQVQTGSKKHRGTYTTEILKSGSIKALLLEYNPDKDVLVVRATVGNNAMGVESQDTIEIPANTLVGVDNIPISVGNRTTTLGEIRKSKKETTVKKKLY